MDSPIESELRRAVERNDKLLVDTSSFPSRVKFSTQFAIGSLSDLLQVLEAVPDGVLLSDVYESCSDSDKIEAIVAQAVVHSLVIAVKKARSNSEIVLFPRGPTYLVALSGICSIPQKGRASIQTTADVRGEISRGKSFHRERQREIKVL